jgi:hypothetical protein
MWTWIRYLWRLISHPYAFFEEAIQKNNPIPAALFFILAWGVIYGGWWLIAGRGIFSGPRLFGALVPLIAYPAGVAVIYLVCHIFVLQNHWRSFFAVWGFSYLPTFGFFLANIGVHQLAKLPWLGFIFGQPLFLMVLWVFILLMLLWKFLFLAITLRLAGNLNLKQIIPAMIILGIVVAGYWWIALRLEWLKIPFI